MRSSSRFAAHSGWTAVLLVVAVERVAVGLALLVISGGGIAAGFGGAIVSIVRFAEGSDDVASLGGSIIVIGFDALPISIVVCPVTGA